jgi:glyoxylase-like metal-dependent hydrolase (beta-lactamase superfamily II)
VILEQASTPCYEVFALRYATSPARRRHENFIVKDPHDDIMPMDYFVWVIRHPQRTILVDTGFNAAAAKARGRMFLRCPIEGLSSLGLLPQDIEQVVLTHLHYDHAGNIDLLPEAQFHIQESELHYACGHHMCQPVFRHAYDVQDIVHLVRRVYSNRVTFHHGRVTLAPGVELIKIGGHTQGLQSVRVHTQRGWLVLASDASHYYENMMRASPFPIVFHVGDMLDGFETLRRLASSPDHIIPGHDPLVREWYPIWGDRADDVVALHLSPTAP